MSGRALSRAWEEAEDVLEKTQLNPWEWQDKLGFSQAWRLIQAFLKNSRAITADIASANVPMGRW